MKHINRNNSIYIFSLFHYCIFQKFKGGDREGGGGGGGMQLSSQGPSYSFPYRSRACNPTYLYRLSLQLSCQSESNSLVCNDLVPRPKPENILNKVKTSNWCHI